MLLSIGIVGFAALLTRRRLATDAGSASTSINLLLIALIGMNGTALAADLFSLYVFLEITAVASFILIALNAEANALEGAFKYLILSAVATRPDALRHRAAAPDRGRSTASPPSRPRSAASPQSLFVRIAVCLFMCGLFIKGGLVPFHGWLPDAYSAPRRRRSPCCWPAS